MLHHSGYRHPSLILLFLLVTVYQLRYCKEADLCMGNKVIKAITVTVKSPFAMHHMGALSV